MLSYGCCHVTGHVVLWMLSCHRTLPPLFYYCWKRDSLVLLHDIVHIYSLKNRWESCICSTCSCSYWSPVIWRLVSWYLWWMAAFVSLKFLEDLRRFTSVTTEQIEMNTMKIAPNVEPKKQNAFLFNLNTSTKNSIFWLQVFYLKTVLIVKWGCSTKIYQYQYTGIWRRKVAMWNLIPI